MKPILPSPPRGQGAFPRTLTTLAWERRAHWMRRVELVRRGEGAALSALWRLVSARGYDALVVDGATGGRVRFIDLGAAGAWARRRVGPTVIVTDATWGRGRGRVRQWMRHLFFRLIDSPRTVYCVLSSAEQRTFSKTWGGIRGRVVFTPFYFTLSDEEQAAPVSEDGSIFAGGDSLCDYAPLVRAAWALDAPVRLATRALEGRRDLAPNVIAGPVSHALFHAWMRSASVVVVPLAAGIERSAGQQTYLNAMALGKITIVTDVLGVRDYVIPGKTAIVVPAGDAAALGRAISWALDPVHQMEAREMAARARRDVRARFGPDRYAETIAQVVERFAQPPSGSSSGPGQSPVAPGDGLTTSIDAHAFVPRSAPDAPGDHAGREPGELR